MARLIQSVVVKHKLMKEPLIVFNKNKARMGTGSKQEDQTLTVGIAS